MNKREYLSRLREYLSYELPAALVKEKLDFYSDYISKECVKGRLEAEVLEDLGDPQLIARSIIDAEKSGPDGIPGTEDDRNFAGEIYERPGAGRSGAFGGYGTGTGGDASRRYDSGDTAGNTSGRDPFGGIRVYNFGCFTAILVLLVVFSVFSLIGGLLGALSPVLAPVCMVILIMWLLGRSGTGGRGL